MDERPDGRFLNKVVLVAGGTGALGQAVSLAFLAELARNAMLSVWPIVSSSPATNSSLFNNLPSGLSSISVVLCFFASCPGRQPGISGGTGQGRGDLPSSGRVRRPREGCRCSCLTA